MEKLNGSLRPSIAEAPENPDAKKLANTLDWLIERPADSAWLIKVLGVYCPDDEIFSKSYRYVRRQVEGTVLYYDNADGFWDNMP